MKKTYLGISIDTDKDKLLSEQAEKLLKDYYCKEGEDSPQMAYARAARAYCYGDLKLAQRIYNYASNKWFMFSSPVLELLTFLLALAFICTSANCSNFSRNVKRKFSVDAIFSTEQLVYPDNEGNVCHAKQANDGAMRLDCNNGFGAATHVTATFAFFATSHCFKKLIRKKSVS